MDPTSWAALVERIGFPAAVCLILLLIMHGGLRRGFGAVHARIDETNKRLGVLAYIMAKTAGDDVLREAEEANGIAPNGAKVAQKRPA